MENCYANTEVTGSELVGGLVGKLIGYLTTGKVMNSYAIGIVTGNSNTGGLVGSNGGNNEDPGQVIASYYDSETTGQNDTGKGEPRTTEEMKTGTPSDIIYTKWSEDIWDFGVMTTIRFKRSAGSVRRHALMVSKYKGRHMMTYYSAVP